MSDTIARRSELAIQTVGLSKSYAHRVVLQAIDLEIRAGQFVLLRGGNGAGKTTLLRCLTGTVRPTTGELFWFGHQAGTRAAIAQWMGMLAHESRLYAQLTLRENLLLAARLSGLTHVHQLVDHWLNRMATEQYAHFFPAQVSCGIRRRVALARAVIHEPPILLLDEPFTGLDVSSRRWLVDQLAQLRRQQRTICLVTHDDAPVAHLVDRILDLKRGLLVEDTLLCTEATRLASPIAEAA
jgi:ABC-type multidrug transport system ATPase subunit